MSAEEALSRRPSRAITVPVWAQKEPGFCTTPRISAAYKSQEVINWGKKSCHMILLFYGTLITFSLFICFLSIISTFNRSSCDILCVLTGNRIPAYRTPNWKKANINQTPHLHARMAEGRGKSVFSSNLLARLSAAEDDRMRPNNGKLSENVCPFQSNIQQQCDFFFFLPKRCTSHI